VTRSFAPAGSFSARASIRAHVPAPQFEARWCVARGAPRNPPIRLRLLGEPPGRIGGPVRAGSRMASEYRGMVAVSLLTP
jgi:hypothetical protein